MPYEGLMLLPLYDDFKLADVMPIDYGMSFLFVYNGWCYCQGLDFLADVNANVWYVADVIAKWVEGWLLLVQTSATLSGLTTVNPPLTWL